MLLLPLLAVPVDAVQAQAADTVDITAFPGPGPYTEGDPVEFFLVASKRPTRNLVVEVTISQQGDFLAGGEAGKRRVTVTPRGQALFEVATRDDRRNEKDGFVIATINPGKGYTSRRPRLAIAIEDDDVPRVSIAPGPAIKEGADATFTLTADPKPASSIKVSLTIRDGQFSSGEELGTRTVSIYRDGRATLKVRTSPDDEDEDDGPITATINPAPGKDPAYEVGSPASASVSVTDGGVPTPRMTISAPTGIQEGETATFTVTARPAPETRVDVTVTLAERGSFAAAGEIRQRTVAVGTDGVGTFTVATENDRTAEADGSINATLADGSGYLVGSPGKASVAVRDTTPRVSIAAGPYIAEGGTATFTLTADPRLSGSFEVDVDVTESGDFADAGETGSRRVTIGADGVGTLEVATFDDATLEEDGTITATVVAGSGYGLGSPASASVGVADTTPRVSISAGAAIIEGATARFTLTADPKPSGTIYVDVDVGESGSFLAGGESGLRSVSIDSSGTGTLAVATDDDSADEEQGRITVRIEDGQAPASYGVGAPRSASLRVNDNDASAKNIAQLSVGDAEVRENARNDGNLTWLEFPVSLDRSTGVGVTARFEVRATTESPATAPATEGLDYRVRHPNYLAVNLTGKTTATVRVEVLDDDEFEEKPETIELVLVDIKGAEIADGKAIGTILPDPHDAPRGTPVVTIEGGRTVVEGRAATFTVSAQPAPEADLVVTVSVHDDDTSDFLAPASEGTHTVTVPGLTDRQYDYYGGVSRTTLDIDTVDDDQREAHGSIRVEVVSDPDPNSGGAYEPGTRDYEASVDIEDNERGVPTVTIEGGPAVAEGGTATFTLRADPAPENDLTVTVDVTSSGGFVASENEGTRTFIVPGVSDSDFARQRHTTAVLEVETVDNSQIDANGDVRVTIQVDDDGNYDADTQPWDATVEVRDNDTPTVSVASPFDAGKSAIEGTSLDFTLRIEPASATELHVNLAVVQPNNDYVDADPDRGTGSRTIVVPANASTAVVAVDTVDDSVVEAAPGTATVTVEEGNGYLVAVPPGNAASAAIVDNDGLPAISIHDATVVEGNRYVRVRMTLSEPPIERVRVDWAVNAARGTATAGSDYFFTSGYKEFSGNQIEKIISILVRNDNHHDPDETIVVELSNPVGLVIADGEAVITITNSDPIPSAWLARFGRTVAEQALDGITARMEAPRASGVEGGAALFAPQSGTAHADLGAPAAGWSHPLAVGGAAPQQGVPADGSLGFGGGRFSAGTIGQFGATAPGHPGGPGAPLSPLNRARSLDDLLLGSRLAWLGGAGAQGGSLAFWGQGSRAAFSGAQDTVDLDGDVTTFLLGADYARNDWLVGVALTQSRGEGGYRGAVGAGATPGQPDRAGPAPATAAALAGGLIETSLTAAIPYASWRASQRLKLWGAVGHGAGDVTLEPQGDEVLKTGIGWTMAAAGLKSDLFAFGGASLALVSDALWARTSSERTNGLAATDGDVSRLRLGLEGSRAFELSGGGSLTPKLELGARHDGGDAETGFGVELGGGIAWSDPRFGLELGLEGRALISHKDGAMRDRGFSASLAYDPKPDSARGLSLALRQDIGGASSGGLDALFADNPLTRRNHGYGDRGADAGRWTMEAGYGMAAFGGRFTGTPHLGYGVSAFGRDLSVGWRLAPEAGPGAPDLSLAIQATRRESLGQPPEQAIGIEVRARW